MPGYGSVCTSIERSRSGAATPQLVAERRRRGPSRRTARARSPCGRAGRRGCAARRRRRRPRRRRSPPGCGRARCGDRPGAASPGSTPRTTSVAVPMPEMSAPIATNISQRSTTSGSRAALSIVVTPSAYTAAVTMFSVAPTLGNPNVTSAPCRRSAVASSSPWLNLNSAPIASSPAMCMSIGRAPKSSPPGIDSRDPPAAREQRAEHVDRRPDPLDQLVRGDRREVAGVGHPQPAGLGDLGADADRRQQLGHDRHVDDRRHVGQLVGAVGEDRRRHQLEHGVLGAGDVDGAAQLADAAHDDLPGATHDAASMLPPCWEAVTIDDRPDAAPVGRERRSRIVREWPDEPGVVGRAGAPAGRPRPRASATATAGSARPAGRSRATTGR